MQYIWTVLYIDFLRDKEINMIPGKVCINQYLTWTPKPLINQKYRKPYNYMISLLELVYPFT